jgi:predicted TIM-barrel fold metal-dependent hydrolase
MRVELSFFTGYLFPGFLMMIIDNHIHIFSPKIIANVSRRREMVERLHLQVEGAAEKTTVAALQQDMMAAGVSSSLMLPTATAAEVHNTNRFCWSQASDHDFLMTAGTLHPDYPDNDEELSWFAEVGIRAIKLCSFSQGFPLTGVRAREMFVLIQRHNEHREKKLFVILDTLFMASASFGTEPDCDTTPEKLAWLAEEYPRINFVGAHMGGLSAPEGMLLEYLVPRPNFYLDTSNAAHTLSRDAFVSLVKTHGPEHIIFGTDWPWFSPVTEVEIITGLLVAAGFSLVEREKVFSGNIAALLG